MGMQSLYISQVSLDIMNTAFIFINRQQGYDYSRQTAMMLDIKNVVFTIIIILIYFYTANKHRSKLIKHTLRC